jgi:hypothetical protein
VDFAGLKMGWLLSVKHSTKSGGATDTTFRNVVSREN